MNLNRLLIIALGSSGGFPPMLNQYYFDTKLFAWKIVWFFGNPGDTPIYGDEIEWKQFSHME